MNNLINIFENIRNLYSNIAISTTTILSVLLVVFLLAAYEFVIYRYVSHRSFYNKSFNISIAVLPFFISTIILCLQSNIVITLGTIGALAIIRYRTAVKDPVDMLYILWSLHIGIVCGCQLYEVAILTSFVVTIVLLLVENITFGKKPLVLILHSDHNLEKELDMLLKKYTKKYRVKSRNFTSNGVDYAIEFTILPSSQSEIIHDLEQNKKIKRFSIIEYDADDIV